MFPCHHNDNNTDIYLRRVITKLDKILEQFDDATSYDTQTKNEIKEKAVHSELVISSVLKQLNILHAEKIHTGMWASIIPDFLRNDDDRAFDFETDVVVALTTEIENYTEEEAKILRKTLLERDLHPSVIERCGLHLIRSNLQEIIEHEIMKIIIKEHNHTVPINLFTQIYNWNDKIDETQSKIMTAIEKRKITNFYEMTVAIKEILLVFNKARTQSTLSASRGI
jgi:hypothetical protein